MLFDIYNVGRKIKLIFNQASYKSYQYLYRIRNPFYPDSTLQMSNSKVSRKSGGDEEGLRPTQLTIVAQIPAPIRK